MTTTGPARSLSDGDLSATYLAADRMSGEGQRRTKRLVRTELVALIVAALAGVTTVRVGTDQLDVLAPISALAFLLALSCTAWRAQTKPEGGWYEGRAGAESARTLAWKYSIGATPFPIGRTDDEEAAASRLFLERLGNVVTYLQDGRLPPPDSETREITAAMKRVRASDLATRRETYRRDRIENQLEWYSRRSRDHGRSARWWLRVAILTSAVGVVMAVWKFVVIDVDLLGVFAAVASSAIAWNQLNQHRNQETAYTVTAHELSIIREEIDLVPEDQWATFAEGAEDAISREHTMWAARRGYGRPSST